MSHLVVSLRPLLTWLGRALLILAGLILGLALPLVASATSFTISTNSTTAQTLGSGAGQTGTVDAGKSLTLGGSTVAVTISGNNALLTNNGTINQTGSGRAVDLNTNNISATVTNNAGASILTVNTDAIRVNNANSAITINNSGTIAVSNGGQALDLAAITTAANVVNNFAGGVISAVGEDAIRPGNNGVVNNAGTISATPIVTAGDASGSDAIDLRTNRSVIVTNSGTITGRHGIATDGANTGPSSLTLTNNAGGVVSALNGSGVNIDGVALNVTANVTNAFGATIKGGVLASTLAGDGDGVDVDGILTLDNSGDILGLGAKGNGSDTGANNAEAVSIGGGTITNRASGRIVGSSLAADAANGDVTRGGNGILADNSSGGSAIAATSITNAGLIQGKTGFGIKLVGNQNDIIDNHTGGVIQGGKTASAAGYAAVVDMGGGNDTFKNAGSVITDGGSANGAISLGAGNDKLTITGGSITGHIDGGLDTDQVRFELGAGNSYTQSGNVVGFEQMDFVSGKVAMNQGNFTGDGVMKFFFTGDTDFGQLSFLAGNAGSGLVLNAGSVLALDFGYSPLVGTQFTLVEFLNASGWVAGTFAGLAEGASFMQGGYDFTITYTGGSGHDIVLTRVASTPDSGATLALLAGALGLLALNRRRLQRA